MTFCNICCKEGEAFEIEALCDDCWNSLNEWIREKEAVNIIIFEGV